MFKHNTSWDLCMCRLNTNLSPIGFASGNQEHFNKQSASKVGHHAPLEQTPVLSRSRSEDRGRYRPGNQCPILARITIDQKPKMGMIGRGASRSRFLSLQFHYKWDIYQRHELLSFIGAHYLAHLPVFSPMCERGSDFLNCFTHKPLTQVLIDISIIKIKGGLRNTKI